VTAFHENGNEPTGSLKAGNILVAKRYSLHQGTSYCEL